MIKEQDQIPWHSLPEDEVLRLLKSTKHGLTEAEVQKRFLEYGENQIEIAKAKSLWKIFLNQFNNVLIYVLLGSCVLTLLLHSWSNAAVILGVVLINAIFGFFQESKAEKAIHAISQMLSQTATVIRGHRSHIIPVSQLVPGDIIKLHSGDKIPADCRLIETHHLSTQESALTGESDAVDKTISPSEALAPLAERYSMVYASTLVAEGVGLAVVVATGMQTEIGKIGKLIQQAVTVDTPLTRKMQAFAKTLTMGILMVAALMVLLGMFWHGYSLTEMIIAGVAFAVAAIPEGLPPVVTITLAIGVSAMAKARAIIRRLPAVETLGSVTVICTDKTGTLTCNEMMVAAVVTQDNFYAVSGSGYTPSGQIRNRDDVEIELDQHPKLKQTILAGIYCNEAELHQSKDAWLPHGSPTEAALLTLALKANVDWQQQRQENLQLDRLPFSSEQKYMLSLHQKPGEGRVLYAKGAPEVIFKMCETIPKAIDISVFWATLFFTSGVFKNSEIVDLLLRFLKIPEVKKNTVKSRNINRFGYIDKEYWISQSEQLATQGYRVLAVAMKPVEPNVKNLDQMETLGFEILGLFGLIDAAREEVAEAIHECQKAGIAVKIITGDRAETAAAVAKKIGLDISGGVISGPELDALDDKSWPQVAKQCAIFARTTPTHKLKLVQALQAQHEVVAMTGDGVNDAPALKTADIGIAMGHKGTEAAKEAAQMVLADDNFATIVAAVKCGRTIYSNLTKTIFYILPTSIGQALAIFVAILLGTTLPITPLQILWINMVTAITLSISLAFEKPEAGIMDQPPRDPKQPIFRHFLIWRMVLVSVLMVLGAYGLYGWQLMMSEDIELARSVTVNTLVAFEIVYLINSRYLLLPTWNWEGLFGNRACLIAIFSIILLQLGFTYLPPVQHLFGVQGLSWQQWLIIIACSVIFYIIVELEKMVSRRYAK